MQLYYRLFIYEQNQHGTTSHLDEISPKRR